MPRIILNLGGEGEVPGAININSLVANRTSVDVIKKLGILIIHDILDPWPFVEESVDEIIGNCLPAFAPEHRLFILHESMRVLKFGCRVRLHAKMLHPDVWKTSMESTGLINIVFETTDGIRHAIGTKP